MDTAKGNPKHFDSKNSNAKGNDLTDVNASKIPNKEDMPLPFVYATSSSSMKSGTFNVDSKVVDLETHFEGLQINSLGEVKEPYRNINSLVQNPSSPTGKFHNETPVAAQTDLKCSDGLQTAQIDYSQNSMASSVESLPIIGPIFKGKLGDKPAEEDGFRLQTKHIRFNNNFTQSRRYKHTYFDSDGNIVEAVQGPSDQKKCNDKPKNVYYAQTNNDLKSSTERNVIESNYLPIIEETKDDKTVEEDLDRQLKKQETAAKMVRRKHTYFDSDGNVIQSIQSDETKSEPTSEGKE